tara:strand:- start:16410 stop:16733 length:324 start_codon:yes stop_codon:yes gene_type:complete
VDKIEKEELKRVIKDRIDELTLVLQPGDLLGGPEDQVIKPASSDVDTAVHSFAARDLRILRHNLEWLDSADGGYCEQCSGKIRRARLSAVPATRLCVLCASQREVAR